MRQKFRYVAAKFTFNIQKTFIFSQEVLFLLIKDLLYQNFGEIGVAKLDTFILIEYLPANNICIFRVPLYVSKEVIYSLITCGSIDSLKCNISIFFISGGLRTLKKRIIKFVGDDKNNY
ncbi:hypothetical protein CWI38_0536p0010 [Hamiltosporidium tvaerminnensis]|uniref:Ribonuclease P/MRP protein subunit POP5 n=1 Tax=Hamiltosporidium tvaerminnensis TaxID=1176355 RepID=A0A4Q9LYS1_9MICR|nr:hypothetical protein CWI37_0037p0060 [Hamiltosporidium tvaerminnensis]TBU13081.1 hypothetical protein CWI38_0536p0010 [Hamiltosporidium tvaerminnensis]